MAFGNLFENLFDTYIVGKASVNVYRCKSLKYFYKIYHTTILKLALHTSRTLSEQVALFMKFNKITFLYSLKIPPSGNDS